MIVESHKLFPLRVFNAPAEQLGNNADGAIWREKSSMIFSRLDTYNTRVLRTDRQTDRRSLIDSY